MILAKVFAVIYPIYLGLAINGITCDQTSSLSDCPSSKDIYMYVALYGGLKLTSDFFNQIREIPFAVVMASAETHIARMVYKHTQE